jgi:hypothetical protein
MSDQATAVETQVDPQAALLDALGGDPPEQQEQVEAAPEEEESPEGEEQPEEQEAEPEKPAVDQKFVVKVKNDAGEDEEREMTLEEMAAGVMLQADYTRKTQALAAEAKAKEQEVLRTVTETQQQAQQQLVALQQLVLSAAAPELQNVNWQQLAMEDPARYVQLQAKQQQLSQVLGAIQAEQQKLSEQQKQTIAQQREQALKHSLDYLSKEIKGFNLKEAAPKLRDVGKQYGFSDEELSQITDGRAIHLLYDAMQWRSLQSAKPKALQKVAEAPKVIKPAAPQPKKTNQAAMDRLKKTGRASELVNFL